MPGPITPEEIHKKECFIPEFVFEAFNELIIANYNGKTAIIKEDDVVEKILQKMEHIPQRSVSIIYQSRWLDLELESCYKKAGWEVNKFNQAYRDKPVDYFIFTRKRNLDIEE